MTTWRVTDSTLQLSGKGSTPEAALAQLKQKIREKTAAANQSYRMIRGQI